MTATTSSHKTALIIGATGGFGGAVMHALMKRGWRIRALAREPEAARAKVGERLAIDWVAGDAMGAAEVSAAAVGVDVIVHGANPPGYRNWAGTVLPMIASSIAAAKGSGARLLVPGNVYNFAKDAGADIAEGAPQHPTTRKGAIRVEMEAMLRRAAEDGVRVINLRAGDFFGPGANGGGAFGWLTVRSKGRVTAMFSGGRQTVGHLFAYLPDLGEAAARLLDHPERLGDYEDLHFRGHWVGDYGDLIAAVRKAAGRKLPVLPFPWWAIAALSPFDETLRELYEMRYLWKQPIGLANERLMALLGEEPHTPLDRAVAATLEDIAEAEAPAFEAPATPPAALASAR